MVFEKGFLSHDRVFTMDSDVLKSIDQGYNFFTTWFNELAKKGTYMEDVIIIFIHNRSRIYKIMYIQ